MWNKLNATLASEIITLLARLRFRATASSTQSPVEGERSARATHTPPATWDYEENDKLGRGLDTLCLMGRERGVGVEREEP